MNSLTFRLRTLKCQRRYRKLIAEAGDNPVARIETHAAYLDEYCLRWLGFCRLDLATPYSVVHHDLFAAVVASSKVAAKDFAKIRQLSRESIHAWGKYLCCLDSIKKGPPDLKKRAEELYRNLTEFVESTP